MQYRTESSTVDVKNVSMLKFNIFQNLLFQFRIWNKSAGGHLLKIGYCSQETFNTWALTFRTNFLLNINFRREKVEEGVFVIRNICRGKSALIYFKKEMKFLCTKCKNLPASRQAVWLSWLRACRCRPCQMIYVRLRCSCLRLQGSSGVICLIMPVSPCVTPGGGWANGGETPPPPSLPPWLRYFLLPRHSAQSTPLTGWWSKEASNWAWWLPWQLNVSLCF